MTGFQIKVLACLFMFIDHFGVIFFPGMIIFRIVGRLSFPIFAWLIAIGYFHTRNVINYLKRLIVFALLLQIPYFIYFKSWDLNIFFTLFLGLFSIHFFDRFPDKNKALMGVVLLAGFGEIIKVDYGMYGVLTIFLFYFFYYDLNKLVISQVLLNIIFLVFHILLASFQELTVSSLDLIQPLSVGALIFFVLYNGHKGRNAKYVFYVFYPVHLVLLYGIKLLIK